jgi:hypothetical protein
MSRRCRFSVAVASAAAPTASTIWPRLHANVWRVPRKTVATVLTGCSRRRKWEFESPEAAAAAKADGCDVKHALIQSVVACCR